jgi:hypothetical protein
VRYHHVLGGLFTFPLAWVAMTQEDYMRHMPLSMQFPTRPKVSLVDAHGRPLAKEE